MGEVVAYLQNMFEPARAGQVQGGLPTAYYVSRFVL